MLVALAMVLLAGCSGPAGSAPERVLASGPVPEFSGPYAEEFAYTYRNSTSDFVRHALADEVVTDAEYAEMTSRLRSCLADQGITLRSIAPGEGMQTSVAPNGGDTHAIVDACSTESGEDAIGLLRDFLTVNPENHDVATITAECLVRSGTVPADYTGEDLTADNAGRFSDPASLEPALRTALSSCTYDPYGQLAAQE